MGVARQIDFYGNPLEVEAGQAQGRLNGFFEQKHAFAVDARLLIGEGLQVGHDALNALHALTRIGQAFLEVGVLHGSRISQSHVDGHQAVVDRVVDLMQQAGSQRAERCHFLALD